MVMEFSSKTTVPLTCPGWLLDEHSSDFFLRNWSPRSSYLNPIEPLWDVREQGVKRHHKAPMNLSELWTALANIWEIDSPVGRNQTTVMRICDRWMQEGTTDRRGRSHPPQCTISREDRQIVHMAVKDRSVTSRTVAQHIESVTHHSMPAHTIRLLLQQSGLSARRPLFGLPLTHNHSSLLHQWCNERRM
ncbi:transposable element Tcb1 transposase [Trichonephila clavipes]|nr:transposable element Tcb1 transposase [Trichonephila clavipes]